MKKCGLRKAYSLGGELQAASEMSDINWASHTNDPDILNAQFDIREKQRALEEQQKYGKLSYRDPVSQNDIAKSKLGLDAALRQNGFLSPAKPQTSLQPALQSPQLPMETTFQQDIDARQQRMAGYRDKLGYAGGGTIDPDALMREMAAKYGTSGAQPQVAAPAPQPAPAPVQAPQPKPTLLDGLRRLATGNLEGRMKAAGFKLGGTVDSKGYIHGEKGVDKVPAKVAETGEDILVSDGERIVNKKQNAALERLAAEAGMGLDEYLEQSTGEPVGPQMKQGLRAAEQGWNRAHMPGDRNYVDFNPAPAPNPNRTSSGTITPYREKLDPEALMMDVAKRHGLNYVAPTTTPTATTSNPTDPDTDGRRKYSSEMNSAFNYRGGERGVPGPSNGPAGENFDSVDRRPVQERQAAGAQAGLEAKGLRNAMQFLGGEGAAVPEGMRFSSQTESNAPLSTWNSKQDVAAQSINNRITPENGTGIMSVKQKDGTFKNVVIGQAEYTGADGKPTSDWSKTQQYADGVAQAQKVKDSLARIQRERAEFDAFDPSITDPAVRQNGLRQVAMNMMKDEAAGKALQHKEERDAMLGLRRDMLEEQKRQFDVAALASEAAARRTAQKEGIKEFDDLVKSAGYEGDEATKFADWFRGNYAGRRHKIDGKDVDVPGFEDMLPDEKRAHMTNAKAMYEWVKQLNKTEMGGNTSMATPKGLRSRKINFDDVSRHTSGLGKGLPVLHSDDPNAPGLLGKGGLVNRLWVPEMLGGASDQVVEEIDSNGSPLRKWLKSNTRGEQGPWGNLDTAAYIDSLTRK